jgi:hypothetical protein
LSPDPTPDLPLSPLMVLAGRRLKVCHPVCCSKTTHNRTFHIKPHKRPSFLLRTSEYCFNNHYLKQKLHVPLCRVSVDHADVPYVFR